MPRNVLGQSAIDEIRTSISACRSSAEIADEVARLSSIYNVSRQRIYDITADLRPRRRPRADIGKRKINLLEDETLRLIVGWILEYEISPADAIVMARSRGLDVPIEFPTLNKYLRELGLGSRSRRSAQTPHRRFEASAPGEMFQFDISGVKTRWVDAKTRRIVTVSTLEVSKNHDNDRPDRVRLWRFALIDDYSRRCFIRYVAVAKPNSSHVVDFLLEAYSELGVPKILYTDNDKIIKFGRNARTTEILNKILEKSGGYQNLFHLPGNSRATGKVERLHQAVEAAERVIGKFLDERGTLTIDDMNRKFAPGVMRVINERHHSSIGCTPMERWHSKLSSVRRLDYEQLRSAFMADEFTVKLRGDLTIRLRGKTYQLPTSELYPFANWIGQKLRVVFPDRQEFFTIIGLDGNEYDVPKTLAAADTAGEFKATRDTDSNRIRRELRQLAREEAKRLRQQADHAPLPYFDDVHPQAAEPENVARFPKPVAAEITPADVAEAAPGRTATHDPALTYWQAVEQFASAFESISKCKALLDTIYPSREPDVWLLQSEVQAAIDRALSQPQGRTLLRAIS